MSRQVKPSDFEGKRVKNVDTRAINCLTFVFDDGKTLVLEVEYIGNSLYGILVSELRSNVDDTAPGQRDGHAHQP